jgi:hypothetical protein
MSSDSEGANELVPIGPGLGKRSKIWAIVQKKVAKLQLGDDSLQIKDEELEKIRRLVGCSGWMDLIPEQWVSIYSQQFETIENSGSMSTKTSEQIVRDVPRTFSLYTEHSRYLRLQFPADMSSYCVALRSVLVKSAQQEGSVGYCQGMNFLAATFLLSECSSKLAYVLVSYMLEQCNMKILFNPRCSSLMEYMEYYERRLENHNHKVFCHLRAHEFPPLCYTVEWFTTCFLVSSPGELSACVIDLILMGFDDIMVRVGLALMDHLETVILQSNAEKLQLNFKKMLLLANCVDVMCRAIVIPSEDINSTSILQVLTNVNCHR